MDTGVSCIFTDERNDLDAIFRPKSVAVIGATERHGSVGRTILWNLISNSFGGTVYPVTPTRPSVLGIRAYPSIKAVPERVDLAIIVTPSKSIPGIVRDCVEQGVQGAVIVSAGFKEVGPEGARLEEEILEIARGRMRIVGPNCLGVMMPRYGLNATFAGAMARPGNVAFLSQSGAICTAILDRSFEDNIGFSAFISIGSMLDVGWGDLIDYLGDDPQTSSIVIYMETIGDARAFLSAAREVALRKPIIVIKAGRTEAAAAAAASHTGSLTGSDDVLQAAFRRVGVLRVDRISEMFDISELLAKQPPARGPRLTIVTNAGGPGVLATDALILGGGELTDISEKTMGALNGFLPAAWSHNNPIDILGDADPERYARSLELAANDENSDGLLVILTPQDMTDPTMTAEKLKGYSNLGGKPLLASWMGGVAVRAGQQILNRANIPTFEYPDAAVRLFNYMWRYQYHLRGLYETPALPEDGYEDAPDRERVRAIIDGALRERRSILTEAESKQVLAAYHIPVTRIEVAGSPEEAVRLAEAMGYPVVLKIHSRTVTHKTDVGGVLLNIAGAEAVRAGFERIRASVGEKVGAEHFHGVSVQPMEKLDGYEIILGSSMDPQFGPVLLFGQGGTLVEVNKDSALGLPPLTTTLARRMMEQTKIYGALRGIRGRAPVDLPLMEKLMVRFSQIVVEQPWIKEMDINPLLASSERILSLDARVVLHDAELERASLPRPAICPYPTQYAHDWTASDGHRLRIRPIRAEDEPLLKEFQESLSAGGKARGHRAERRMAPETGAVQQPTAEERFCAAFEKNDVRFIREMMMASLKGGEVVNWHLPCKGQTKSPVVLAAEKGESIMLKLLFGMPMKDTAVKVEAVKVLLEKAMNSDKHLKVLNALLESPIKAQVLGYIRAMDATEPQRHLYTGETLLNVAAKNNCVGIIEAVLDLDGPYRRAMPDAQSWQQYLDVPIADKSGLNALGHAVMKRSLEAVKLLNEAGADKHYQRQRSVVGLIASDYMDSPLEIAQRPGLSEDIVALLLAGESPVLPDHAHHEKRRSGSDSDVSTTQKGDRDEPMSD